MASMTIEVPDEALGALRKSLADFITALRLVAAVKRTNGVAILDEGAARFCAKAVRQPRSALLA